jgi:nitric oxide dioxygenase
MRTAFALHAPPGFKELILTPSQKALIAESYAWLAADIDASAELFYRYLFEKDPPIRQMFPASMTKQGRKFMDMLGSTITCLDRMDRIVPLLWQIGKRHEGYGVTDAHYALACDALLWAIEQRSPHGITQETRAAWQELYSMMARAMQQSAGEGGIPRVQPLSSDAPFPVPPSE